MARRSLHRFCKLPQPVSAAFQAMGEVAKHAEEATDKVVQSALPLLGGDPASWQQNIAQSKKEAAKSLESGLNESFQNLRIPFNVKYINGHHNGHRPDNLQAKHINGHHKSESLAEVPELELQRRLLALEDDRRRIKEYLKQKNRSAGVSSQIPREKSTYSYNGAEVNVPAQILNTAEGLETYEDGALIRRLRYWQTVNARAEVPYGMLSDFHLYPEWMPWCTAGNVLQRDPNGLVTNASVEFGMKLGSLPTLGDCIEYEVDLEPPTDLHRSCRVYTVSRTSKYAQKLVFDWRFIPVVGEFESTKVVFDVEYIGLATWCLPMWDAAIGEVIKGMSTSFRTRLEELKRASASAVDKGVARQKISKILGGNFLQDQQPFVVTESDGGTIRHANLAFAKLVGTPCEALPGKCLPDVLNGVGAAPNGAQSGLLNRLRGAFGDAKPQAASHVDSPIRLHPAVDDERSTEGVFWGIVPAA